MLPTVTHYSRNLLYNTLISQTFLIIFIPKNTLKILSCLFFVPRIAYYPKSKKYDKAKFRLKLTQKSDLCRVDFMEYKQEYIYLSGYLQADHHMAVFVFENYKENNLRFELSHIILNIVNGTDKLMLGTFHCTNGEYTPSIRKCIVSKNDIEFTDDLLDKLKITEAEKENLNEHNILYLDITDTYAFESE